jgi:hypothetical protein
MAEVQDMLAQIGPRNPPAAANPRLLQQLLAERQDARDLME